MPSIPEQLISIAENVLFVKRKRILIFCPQCIKVVDTNNDLILFGIKHIHLRLERYILFGIKHIR
jgi:hypothetical protein